MPGIPVLAVVVDSRLCIYLLLVLPNFDQVNITQL